MLFDMLGYQSKENQRWKEYVTKHAIRKADLRFVCCHKLKLLYLRTAEGTYVHDTSFHVFMVSLHCRFHVAGDNGYSFRNEVKNTAFTCQRSNFMFLHWTLALGFSRTCSSVDGFSVMMMMMMIMTMTTTSLKQPTPSTLWRLTLTWIIFKNVFVPRSKTHRLDCKNRCLFRDPHKEA
jgi:hypothetical protein